MIFEEIIVCRVSPVDERLVGDLCPPLEISHGSFEFGQTLLDRFTAEEEW